MRRTEAGMSARLTTHDVRCLGALRAAGYDSLGALAVLSLVSETADAVVIALAGRQARDKIRKHAPKLTTRPGAPSWLVSSTEP